MPICLAEEMQPLVVSQITGSDKIRTHLKNLGFVPGAEIMVIHKIHDNVIVKIKGVSLAISYELAKRIYI